MTSNATTVDEYLAGLPEDRRAAISAVREVILRHLPEGYEEGILYGMIGYYVPHSLFPQGYHCNPKDPLGYACLASQKNYMSLYLSGVYGDSEEAVWFKEAWHATGKKLDMGKSCVRFRKLEDLPLEVIGQAIARKPWQDYVAGYVEVLSQTKGRKPKTG